jgi:hypothetical protein
LGFGARAKAGARRTLARRCPVETRPFSYCAGINKLPFPESSMEEGDSSGSARAFTAKKNKKASGPQSGAHGREPVRLRPISFFILFRNKLLGQLSLELPSAMLRYLVKREFIYPPPC